MTYGLNLTDGSVGMINGNYKKDNMMSEQDKLKEEVWWIAYNDCKLSHIAHIQDYFKAGYDAAPKGIDKAKLLVYLNITPVKQITIESMISKILNRDFDLK